MTGAPAETTIERSRAPISATVERQPFRPDIQGMRALAVGLVVLYHAGLPVLPGGFIGVDIFFVISGFLITNHLLTGLLRDGRIGFAQFYARRARRILPASFVVILLTIAASMLWVAPLQLDSVFKDAIATALYVPNMLFAAQGTNYLAESAPSLFQHYWSLGVEEQFYLVWPLFLFLVFTLARRSRRALLAGVVVFLIVSIALCVFVTQQSQPWAFFSLPTRAWEFAIGGLLAFPELRARERVGRPVAAILSWGGLVGLVVIAAVYTAATPFPGVAALAPVVAAALVIGFTDTAGSLGPARLLSLRWIVFIGTISYSLYLVHWPMMQLPAQAGGLRTELPLWAGLSIAVVCVPVAWLLYRFVELPGQRLPILARARPRRTLLAAGAASVLIVALSSAGIVALRAVPLATDHTVASVTVGVSPPSLTTFVPADVTPALADAADDNPEIYANGCHLGFGEVKPADHCTLGANAAAPLVALFGDSHAAQWYPPLRALAESGVIRLITYTKSSCPASMVDKVLDGVPYRACEQWRGAVLADLAAGGVSTIVVGNSHEGVPIDDWAAGLRELFQRLPAGVPVVEMADTPRFAFNPAECLSAHLTDALACSSPRSAALDAEYAQVERDAAREGGAAYADLNDYLCTDVCGTVIGAHLVYRDDNHMDKTFSATLADPLRDVLIAQAPPATDAG